MAWSGHRTMSMLLRYHIIDLEDLRRSGKRASDYRGPKENVTRPTFGGTRTDRRKIKASVPGPVGPRLS
jgi:hypothetical protein